MTLNVVNISGDTTIDGQHANMLLNVTAAAAITVPKSTTYDYTNSDKIRIVRNTSGAVTFVAATDVTIKSIGSSLAISAQNGVAQLEKISTDVWVLSENI